MEVKDYSIKGMRESFKKQGVFYTPEELALLLKSFIDIDYKTAYDPTCGRGSLLSVLDDSVEKYGQELNENELEVAKKTLTNFTGEVGDTLKNPAFLDKKFDVILANPPFSIKWEPVGKEDERFKDVPTIPTASRADYAFLLHILYMLKDDGMACVLNFPGILYRGGREGIIRKWMVENGYIEKIISIPKDTFVDTTIETCLLILKKNRQNKDIEFISTELDESRVVPFEELKDNDFKLTVSQYVFEEKPSLLDSIDPIALELEAREALKKNIKNSLTISLFAYLSEKDERLTLNKLIDEIMEILNEFRNYQGIEFF